MKAVFVTKFGGPEVFEIRTTEKPVLGKNEIMIRIMATGINPVETYIRNGAFFPDNYKPPFVLGSDFAGVIEEVSPELKDSSYKEGQRVFGFLRTKYGTYCEYVTVNPETEVIGFLPDNNSFEQGAAIAIPYFTGYKALFNKAKMTQGQTVMVHGASGGVGLAVIEIAKSFQCKVIATVGTDVGEKNCMKSGADKIFYHNKKGYIEEIKNYCKAECGKVDIIIENCAHFNINEDIDIIKNDGNIVVVGARSNREVDLQSILIKEVNVMGVLLLTSSIDNFTFWKNDVEKKLSDGTYNPTVISYSLSETSDAHKEIINPSSGGAKGKIVISI